MASLGLRTAMAERDRLARENERLRSRLAELGEDPDTIDLRDPENAKSPGR